MKRLKLRHDDKVACPYLEGRNCSHPRCIRLMNQECKYGKNKETLYGRGQIAVIRREDVKARAKYLRRVKHGKN